MRVRISNADLLGDLKGYLEAAEMERAPSSEQAEREVAIYLTTWQVMHPGSYARIVGDGTETPPA